MEEIKMYPYREFWIRVVFDDEYGPIWEIANKEDQSECLYRVRAENYNLTEIVEIFKEDFKGICYE